MKAVLSLALLALFVPTIAQVAYPNNPECGWGDQVYRAVGDWAVDAGSASNWDPAEPKGVMTPTYNQPCEYNVTVKGLVPNKSYNWKVTINGQNTGFDTTWGCYGWGGANCQFTADPSGGIVFIIVAKDAYVLSTKNIPLTYIVPQPKRVFAHYMMGFTANNDQSFFLSTIAAAQAVGIDAFAVNVGTDSFQMDKFKLFIDAAAMSNFKLFISLDMDSIYTAAVMNNWINTFANHSAYFRYTDVYNVSRPFVSTFSGQWTDFGYGVGNAAWNQWKTQDVGANNIYFCPAWFAADSSDLAGLYDLFPVIDCLFSWDAWEKQISNNRDLPAISAAQGKMKTYMAGVAPWFYVHIAQKNYFWPSGPDDGAENIWTIRWKQAIASGANFAQVVTWNDYSESSYIAPIASQEVGTDFTSYVKNDGGMDHVAFLQMTSYFAQWFKTGVAPTIETNSVYYWYRIHGRNQNRTDPLGAPTMYWSNPSDCVSVQTFSNTTGGVVSVSIGGRVTTILINTTDQYTCVPFNGVGAVKVSVQKFGRTYTGTFGPDIQGNGSTYNFNVWSGALTYPTTAPTTSSTYKSTTSATGTKTFTATRSATRTEVVTFMETYTGPEVCSGHWDQCGGIGFRGPKCCKAPYSCRYSNDWYSQCL